jgi:Flp pilus assembly protein TadG
MRVDPRSRRRRRGYATIELLLVFPLLLALLLCTVELAVWLGAQQQVTLAAREGARVAATGGTPADVNAAVQLALGNTRYQQANVQAALTDANGNPVVSGAPVAVTVSLPATAVVPDLLIFIGISIRNESLVSQTVMRKE